MSQKGDFKYLILDLLKDKPNNGYEIIPETLRTRYLERRGYYGLRQGSGNPITATCELARN